VAKQCSNLNVNTVASAFQSVGGDTARENTHDGGASATLVAMLGGGRVYGALVLIMREGGSGACFVSAPAPASGGGTPMDGMCGAKDGGGAVCTAVSCIFCNRPVTDTRDGPTEVGSGPTDAGTGTETTDAGTGARDGGGARDGTATGTDTATGTGANDAGTDARDGGGARDGTATGAGADARDGGGAT
jgi:hypothetical protein